MARQILAVVTLQTFTKVKKPFTLGKLTQVNSSRVSFYQGQKIWQAHTTVGRPTASILKELNFPQLNFWRVHSNHARQSRRSSLSKKSFCSHFAFVPDVNSTNKPNTNTFATTNDFTTVATKEESLYASSHSTFCFGNNTVDDQAVLHRLFRGHSSGLRIYCNHNTWW